MATSEYLETKWRQAFKFHDVDNDGFLTKNDFERIADNISIKSRASPAEAERTKEEWVKWFRYLQPDPSVEKIDEQRFLDTCAELYRDVENYKILITASIGDVFDRTDFNGDGSISPGEFEIFYTAMGVENRDVILRIFRHIDKDDDGLIDREEFIEAAIRHYTNPDPIEGYSIFYGTPGEDFN